MVIKKNEQNKGTYQYKGEKDEGEQSLTHISFVWTKLL